MPNTTQYVPTQPLPYGCQTLGAEEIEAAIAVLKSPYLTQGPAIAQFEKAVADTCQVPYAVAFANGTAALQGAYYAAGLGPGDEGITTPLTFVATANAMLYQQATPVFAEIDPDTWNLDPEAVAAKLSPKTKVLAPVHFAGQPVDLTAFYALADAHGLVVIEDACHALGAWYQGKPIGHCRDMAVFSFHPVKSITTGEGGMVVTPHRHYYEKLLQFRSHGIVRDSAQFTLPDAPPWHYEMQDLGFNYRMTDLQAAIGTVQVGKLEGFIQARNRLAQRYREAFADISALRMQQLLPNTRSADHLFPVCLNPEVSPISRLALFQQLVAANIRPQVHYRPVHLQPYYQQRFGYKPGDFPHAEAYAENCLSLPLYPTLSDEAQGYVIDQMHRLLAGTASGNPV